MLKELDSIKIISEYLCAKSIIPSKITTINQIYDFFSYLQKNKHKFFTLYIYNYLYRFISSNEVAKRKRVRGFLRIY